METRVHNVTCPECGVVNDYEIQKVELLESDAAITYYCACGCRYTNTYALVYLGGFTSDYYYDRDNLKSDR